MSNNVYPNQIFGIMPTVLKTAEFAAIVHAAASGADTRILQMQNPLWHFQLSYEQLFNDTRNSAYSASELQTLMGFFLGQKAQFDDFLFDDPEDDSVVNQAMQLVNDGAGNYYTPLQRNMAGLFFEDVTDLNPLNGSGLTVQANGVAQTIGTCGGSVNCELHGPGLTIPGYSFGGMYLKWCAAPTPPITASFNFYFRLRFDGPTLDFERFLWQLWTIGGAEGKSGSGFVKMVTSRPIL